jgi:hypothetical protein
VLWPMCGHWVNGGVCAEEGVEVAKAAASAHKMVRHGIRREGSIQVTSYLIKHRKLQVLE